jgi:phosphatidylglycerophosphatase C
VAAAAHRDRDRLRAVATRAAFTRRPFGEVGAAARRFGSELVDHGLRSDTTARLRWHRDQGHRILIVSASYEPYVQVVAAALGVEAVLATRLEVVDGVCTGRLEGRNCRGPEKTRRLAAWMDAAALRRDEVTVWAYGDSAGDRELLELADHPVWVREPLASVAPSG